MKENVLLILINESEARVDFKINNTWFWVSLTVLKNFTLIVIGIEIP